ncbi:GHKL domain-containing protein [Aquimarina sp. MAR_2010_214]|uniref:sensor histidine kinase n=1 Tax=Aquimarina sp. MAR_2010_214 TaxID=1250026 RepID=UPI000C710C0D|nr:sensor histidine kinase [Aquimarina sp. MAR_2010_214]PKV51277.1 GHKL domain-containing protein [Aquimarina sp. MAR_2010_214]
MKIQTLDTRKKNILIHVLVLFTIILIVVFSFVISDKNPFTLSSLTTYFLQVTTSFLLLIAPPVYFNIYWIIPRYLVKKRYFIYIVLLLITIIGWGYIIGYSEPLMDQYWFNQPDQEMAPESGITGMIVIILVSTLLNLSYRWFIQLSKINQIENDRLHLELSLLKNQINPHFFFNTLNNLYALSLEKSDKTPSLILKLSEIMRYTIYDCKEPRVSIGGEVTYLENFIELQKMRHHNRGIITFEKKIDDASKQIAPMILIVFLENAFKHGFDHMEKNAFINFKLQTTEKILHLHIENNFSDTENENDGGIGLENVKRRLSLIYPNAHELKIDKMDTVFTIDLKLNL